MNQTKTFESYFGELVIKMALKEETRLTPSEIRDIIQIFINNDMVVRDFEERESKVLLGIKIPLSTCEIPVCFVTTSIDWNNFMIHGFIYIEDVEDFINAGMLGNQRD